MNIMLVLKMRKKAHGLFNHYSSMNTIKNKISDTENYKKHTFHKIHKKSKNRSKLLDC